MADTLSAPLLVLVDRAKAGDDEALQELCNIASALVAQDALFTQQGKQVLGAVIECLLPRVLRFEVLKLQQVGPAYLSLPAPLAHLEQDPLYTWACHLGRLWYRADLYSLDDETWELVRVPRCLIRQEIAAFVDYCIRVPDVHLHLTLPLAYRVGTVVGWLSALSISQKNDALAGLVLLSTLVTPLLVAASAPSDSVTKPSTAGVTKRLAAARPGRRSTSGRNKKC